MLLYDSFKNSNVMAFTVTSIIITISLGDLSSACMQVCLATQMPTSTKLNRLPWHCIATTVSLLIWTHSYSLEQIARSILSFDVSGPTTHRAICFLWPPQFKPSTHPDLQNSEHAARRPADIQYRKPWDWPTELREHSVWHHKNKVAS